MGRVSDYDYYDSDIPEALWWGAFKRATTSKRGVERLKEIAAILDAMPDKRLITNALKLDGACCFVGAVCTAKNVRIPEGECDIMDTADAGKRAGLPWTLAWEMARMNDESWRALSPEDRWCAARAWVDQLLAEAAVAT